MKKLFYIGLIGLALFEFLKVYFIMPFPGSQTINSLDVAYAFHVYRWMIRITFLMMIAVGAASAFSIKIKWIPALAILPTLIIAYYFNYEMTAESIFKEPANLVFKNKSNNTLGDSAIVVGVQHNGQVKAYPVQFIIYHHQVRDTVGGKQMMITYCSVCRTGRVFEPVVQGKPEQFRLVGMDHFNAMFEDQTTRSWWRQVNGEAVTGRLKGEKLPEVESFQMSIGKLFQLYPDALVMQADALSLEESKYDSLAKYERGKSKGNLTRTDSVSWNDKSWVIGVEIDGVSKAYDWIELKSKRVVNDEVGNTPIVIALSHDDRSFVAFRRPADSLTFTVRNDSLFAGTSGYNFAGKGPSKLARVNAYQEFWHSWKTFHPSTTQYNAE
ncbi:MAG: DUF3179 domain-containing (seleno)protein [Bacteroidota bacterium]